METESKCNKNSLWEGSGIISALNDIPFYSHGIRHIPIEIEAAPTEVLLPTSARRLSLLPAPSPLYPAPRAHCRAQRALTVAFHHAVALSRPMSLLLPCKPVCSSPKCRMQRVHIVTRSRMTPLSRAHHAWQVVNRYVSRRWCSASVAEFETMLHTLGLFACVASRLVRVLIHTR